MKLGKYQKAWIKSLRDNHERQMKGALGSGTPENYKACCLGEGLLTICRLEKIPFPFLDDEIVDFAPKTITDENTCALDKSTGVLISSYGKLGLKDDCGSFLNGFKLPARGVKREFDLDTLTAANDNGYSWLEIADLLESQPENFFVNSK